MKIIILLLSVFLFVIGCNMNLFSQFSTSGESLGGKSPSGEPPSCKQQFDSFRNCSIKQYDLVDCFGNSDQGRKFSDEVNLYCGGLYFSPDSQEKCPEESKQIPDILEALLQSVLERCKVE